MHCWGGGICERRLREQECPSMSIIYITYNIVLSMMPIDRSIRLRPRRTCEQEHVNLSNAILHNSAARAKHTRTHVRLLSDFGLRNQGCDWSIRNGAELNGSVDC